MRDNMDETDAEEFDRFIERHWKKAKTPETVAVSANNVKIEETEDKPKKRGRKPKVDKIFCRAEVWNYED